MALTIVHALHLHGQIRQDEMAGMFGVTYQADPYRGYGCPVLFTYGVHDRSAPVSRITVIGLNTTLVSCP